MAHLTYYTYKGFGEIAAEKYWYSQAVRLGDRIECAGQGGWDPTTGQVSPDLGTEADQAFANVDLALRHAGGKGWSQVYRVNLYLTSLDDELTGHMFRNCAKWMPNHKPIMTMVGVTRLGLESMHCEVEVVAHDEEGAKVAAAKK